MKAMAKTFPAPHVEQIRDISDDSDIKFAE